MPENNSDKNKSNLTQQEVLQHIRETEAQLHALNLHGLINKNINESTTKTEALAYLQMLQGELARARRLGAVASIEQDSMTDAERMRISVSLDRVTREDRFRVTAFYAGLACVVIFSLAALTFAAWAVIGTSKIESGGWFLMLLPPAFILPATIIFISIIRAVYPAGKNNTESTSASDNIPHVKLFNELFNAAKDSSS